MDCTETRRLLGAHLDEELDVVNDAAVAAHLEGCPACAEAALALAEQRRLLQEKMVRHRAPDELAAQIRAALPAEARAPRRPVRQFSRLMPLAVAASLALAGWIGFAGGERHARAQEFAGELTAAHARARLTGHMMDVESSDRHTVKPWFAGRVDFAPFVPDLAAQGFPLAGGRLERIGGRTVATLVYRRRLHTIDLHVWSGGSAPAVGTGLLAGYSLAGWQAGGLNYAAVSDLSPEELAGFASTFRAAK